MNLHTYMHLRVGYTQLLALCNLQDEDDVCERVRSRGRCRALDRCSNENAVRPSTGCCPICGKLYGSTCLHQETAYVHKCMYRAFNKNSTFSPICAGGVLTAVIDEDSAGLLPDHLNNVAIVTAMIFRSRFINNTLGDVARRCFIRGYLTRHYDYEVVLEAKDDEDGEFCFQVAHRLRDIINNAATSDVITSDDPADQPPVILSALVAATSAQSLAEENQLPAGGGASSAWLCSPLLLVSVLLAACRLL